jgi:hypothetical protein
MGNYVTSCNILYFIIIVTSVINSKTKGKNETIKFLPSKSKHIIDQIDKVLAEHYGFTDKELDFIINYDIKYRMGNIE